MCNGTKIKLFCIPYAGGSARTFLGWKRWLDPSIELIAVELTGRGDRAGLPLYNEISEAVADICSFVVPQLNGYQYAFFGHSMGSLLVYETIRSLQLSGIPEPVHLFFSGRYAPFADKKPIDAYLLDDKDFIKFISSTFGTMDGLIENRDFLDFFLPLIRSDIKMVETYRHTQDILKLHCPVTFMTGIRDTLVETDDYKLWEKCTSGPFSVLTFDGGHFFISKYKEDIIEYINDALVAQEPIV